MDQEVVMYTCTMEYYFRHKKEKTLPLATIWMDLEGIVLSEISQIERDKYCMLSFICGLLKRKKTQKPHRKRDQICGYQRQDGVWGNWMKVVKRYKLSAEI